MAAGSRKQGARVHATQGNGCTKHCAVICVTWCDHDGSVLRDMLTAISCKCTCQRRGTADIVALGTLDYQQGLLFYSRQPGYFGISVWFSLHFNHVLNLPILPKLHGPSATVLSAVAISPKQADLTSSSRLFRTASKVESFVQNPHQRYPSQGGQR